MATYTVTAHVYLTITVDAHDEDEAEQLAEEAFDEAIFGTEHDIDPGKFNVDHVESDEGGEGDE